MQNIVMSVMICSQFKIFLQIVNVCNGFVLLIKEKQNAIERLNQSQSKAI